MAKNIYALLVGIDEYDPASVPPVPLLKGCVNDIRAIEEYLRERTKEGEWNLVEPDDLPWVLTNEQATRQEIIKGFQQHLCNADSEDVVFFYYSGHGAQEKAPEEFWNLEPDYLDETLVCHDSRTPDGRDLADKELGYLISKVAKNNPHVLLILDCCHSGTGTRDLASDVTVRRGPVDSRDRSLSSFIFNEEKTVLDELLTSSRNLERKTAGVVLPKGKHVMFSACRDYELAKEYKGEDGQHRGAFSYFLLQTLQRTNGSISYRDLARNLNALVSGKVREQSPQVEAIDPEELNKPFLGGAIPERPFYFTLSRSKNENSWVIDGGVLHGILKPTTGDTFLAIFPAGSTPEQLRQLSKALGEAKVTQVMPQRSKVQITKGSVSEASPPELQLSENESYWAVITALPLPPLKVFIKGEPGEEVGIELVRQALLSAGPDGGHSLFVHQVDVGTDADYNLLVRNGQYGITQPTDDRPLVAPIPVKPDEAGYTSERAQQVIQRLEHIARWNNILELSSPATSRIKPNDVEMEVIILSGRDTSASPQNDSTKGAAEQRVEYSYENGEWIPPKIKIKLTNHSQKTLFCNVIDISESFSVSVPFFDERSSLRIPPKGIEGDGTVESSFDDLVFVIPEDFLEQGITEYKDVFKLIVSTTDFDASLLEQPALDLPPFGTRGFGQGTLNRLMSGVHTREVVRSGGNYDDWMTKAVTFTVVRPQEGRVLQSNESTVLQQGVVELQPHPSLQAKAALTTIPQASRDLGNLILPAILRQDSALTETFQFTTTRGSDPGLSALELNDVQDYTVVTPEAPLKLVVDTALAEGEHLLPIAFDGEFFLPLGQGVTTEQGKTEITLERLPKPLVSSRSLQGSIRIFFQKVVSQKLGSPFEYPILSAAEVRDDETVVYEKNQEKVKAQVAQAQKIVLYIHGIIGDTQSMVPSIRRATVDVDGQQRHLSELYDLVLGFDYENLQTTIEENGRLLRQRLEAVGLGPNHGKELHIVAHSMGGLVSRWFIEREGGNQIVQHLVMLGTPNGGSPWPAVQDWIFAALGIGLNQLSAIVWPTKVVADLLQFLESNDYSLEQMQPDSPFLKAIAQNSDPHVPYTIVAGDRSIVPAAMETQLGKDSSSLKRLMERLFGKAVDKVVNLTFFEQPNDIAVTLASIKSVSATRSPQPKILLPDAACDHLTYFTTKAGLDALANALHSSPSRKPQPPLEAINPEGVASSIASSMPPEESNLIALPPNLDAVTTVSNQEPSQHRPSIQPPLPLISEQPPVSEPIAPDNIDREAETRSWLNGAVIGAIVLLLAGAIFGLTRLKRSPQPDSAKQGKTSQSLVISH
ncbi:MAG: caspase family protein [Symplocastrum torsivum CPER-KK1]|jgi:pimeloyl-ACP methyl ester carboxylesterase|uniref:Caspase family protein n=1 Tax=Symplocastrum torsivum CPER-KK1 TaxID=450513 RepID=A0A951UBC0_9CYAN|nr:caspase family protein [Symplocastrum torsivum CPER-KK1]